MREQGRLARNGAEQQVLETAADDSVEHRVLPHGHRHNLNDVALGALAVVLREFAEWAFQLADLRQQAALDHDFRIGRNAQIVGDAFHHRQRRAMQRAGDRQFIEIDAARSPATTVASADRCQ